MRSMADRLRPPAFKEGFDKITVVRVKGAAAPVPTADGEAVNAPEAAVEG
jgi:hypothetical protein